MNTHWISRFKGGGDLSPISLGLSIAIGVLLIRCAFDGFFLVTWGFPQDLKPLWQSNVWWPEIINATLIGYIPAVLAFTRRGIDHDLALLRPKLLCGDTEVVNVRNAAIGPVGLAGRAFMLSGLLGGVVLVYVDPSLTSVAEPSLTNPAFVWPLLRIPVFSWLIFSLINLDFNATRTYLHLGRNLIEVDLLDIQSLSPLALRGLRSALTWVIFSIIVSLFWLGEDIASQQNLPLLITVLSMATATFIIPLIGIHNNILSAKRQELGRLRDEIRIERAVVVNKQAGKEFDSPRLANLIVYYQLIDRVREWPIDAASLFKFLIYLIIGLGSWLGGAVVERLLDRSLGA